MTVLIADDNESSRDLLRTVLVHLGHDVVEACNGREAVRLARERIPALMILDLQMPEMSGYAAVETLRAEPVFASIPILALTAYAMQGDRERALAAGFSEYLTKPIRLAALREELHRWCNGYTGRTAP